MNITDARNFGSTSHTPHYVHRKHYKSIREEKKDDEYADWKYYQDDSLKDHQIIHWSLFLSTSGNPRSLKLSQFFQRKYLYFELKVLSLKDKLRKATQRQQALFLLFLLFCSFHLSVFVLDRLFQTHGFEYYVDASHRVTRVLNDNTKIIVNDNLRGADSRPTVIEEKKFQGSDATSFAVVMNTYKRPLQLHEAVRHYADTCGKKYGVSQVFIVWAELDKTPPKYSAFFNPKNIPTNRASVTVMEMEKDSLNSRFLPIEMLETSAVFMVDDDVQVDCVSLARAFEAWKTHPLTVVGFYPRIFDEKKNGDFIYHGWDLVYLRNRFSFILTKAAFFHERYLHQYSSELHPQEIKDFVDKSRNCEDIAMNFLIANATKNMQGTYHHPIYVEGNVYDKGLFGGISTGADHFATRSSCIREIARIYKEKGWGVPLFDMKLTDRSWLQHYPGFSWQLRPSNFFEWFSRDIFDQ